MLARPSTDRTIAEGTVTPRSEVKMIISLLAGNRPGILCKIEPPTHTPSARGLGGSLLGNPSKNLGPLGLLLGGLRVFVIIN